MGSVHGWTASLGGYAAGTEFPFLDRFAYSWMWVHGGWDIVPHLEPDPGEGDVGEPLVPKPSRPTLDVTRELTEG